jgi:hypothetical protein
VQLHILQNILEYHIMSESTYIPVTASSDKSTAITDATRLNDLYKSYPQSLKDVLETQSLPVKVYDGKTGQWTHDVSIPLSQAVLSLVHKNGLIKASPDMAKRYVNGTNLEGLIFKRKQLKVTTVESLAKDAIVSFKESVLSTVSAQLDLLIGDLDTLLSQGETLHDFNALSIDMPQLNISEAIALQNKQRYAVAIATHKERLTGVRIINQVITGSELILRVQGELPEQYRVNVNHKAVTAERTKLMQALELFAGDTDMTNIMQSKLEALDNQYELIIDLKERV